MQKIKLTNFSGYEICDNGNIISLPKINRKYPKILKATKNGSGYMIIELKGDDGKSYIKSVHKLVAEGFIENPNGYNIINHKDGDKTNNNVNNLEWCTQKHNVNHAYKELNKPNHRKLTNEQAEEIINKNKNGLSSRTLSKEYNLDHKSVLNIINGKTYVEKYPELNNDNYYEGFNRIKYASFSEFKDFCGTGKIQGCEARSKAILEGKWYEEPSPAMLEGSYVDRFFEGTLDKFIEEQQNVIFNKKGEKYTNFKKCDEAIERCLRDKLFMKFMSGEKQKIFTFELFGMLWKSKLDVFHPHIAIVDLKYIKDLHEMKYVKDWGKMTWIEYFGYDFQGALYQKAVEINTGEKLPYYICAVDKGKYPDIDVIKIPQSMLDNALEIIEYQSKRYKAVKYEGAEADRCETCDYCRATKVLTKPILVSDLGNDIR